MSQTLDVTSYDSVIAIGVKDGPLTLVSLDSEHLVLGESKQINVDAINYVRGTKQGFLYGLGAKQLSVLNFNGLNTGISDTLITQDIGRDPTAVEVSPDGQLVYTAHWADDILSVRRLNDLVFETPQDFACGWAHQFRPHPNGKWAYAACMKNTLMQFDVEASDVTPMAVPKVMIKGGPRHLEFHPDGQSLYVLLQITSEVAVFDIDPVTGALSDVPKQIIASTSDGAKDKSSDVHITPDGRWLYAFNRDRQDMAVFKVLEDRRLLLNQMISMDFGEIRDWAMSEDGRFLVTGSDEGHIGVWEIDSETGALHLSSEHTGIGNAISVAILK